MDVQWYPGHMTKALRMLKENLALVDIVIELLDARIPNSSKNPDIAELAKNKKRILLLNKADLADEAVTLKWQEYYTNQGYNVLMTNSEKGNGLDKAVVLARKLMEEKVAKEKARGRIMVPIRSMIVGIPNVGKSTMINRIARKNIAKAADRPGVTRGKQWIKIQKDFELLDTPGILWPKFDDPAVGINLALTGAVNDNIIDIQTLALELCSNELLREPLMKRYGVAAENIPPQTALEQIGQKRGLLVSGGAVDLKRTSVVVLDEFRGGRLGRISLERPPQ